MASRNTDKRQEVSEVKSSVPDAHLEALPVIGVQPQPIGEMRPKGIRHRPMLFDGIEPPTRKTAPPLTVDIRKRQAMSHKGNFTSLQLENILWI